MKTYASVVTPSDIIARDGCVINACFESGLILTRAPARPWWRREERGTVRRGLLANDAVARNVLKIVVPTTGRCTWSFVWSECRYTTTTTANTTADHVPWRCDRLSRCPCPWRRLYHREGVDLSNVCGQWKHCPQSRVVGVNDDEILSQDPLEAILVIFGRRALIFFFFASIGPCAFFFLCFSSPARVAFGWKPKKNKKNWGSQNQNCWPSMSCAQHLHVALADSIEWTSKFLHGYCEEEEELFPSP